MKQSDLRSVCKFLAAKYGFLWVHGLGDVGVFKETAVLIVLMEDVGSYSLVGNDEGNCSYLRRGKM